MSAWVAWQRMPTRYQRTKGGCPQHQPEGRHPPGSPRQPSSARQPNARRASCGPSVGGAWAGQRKDKSGVVHLDDQWSPRSAGLPGRRSAYINTLKLQRRIASARRYADDESYMEQEVKTLVSDQDHAEVLVDVRPKQASSPRPDFSKLRLDVTSPRFDVNSPRLDVSHQQLDVSSPRSDISSPRHDVSSPRHQLGSPRHIITSPRHDENKVRHHVNSPPRGISTPKRNVKVHQHSFNAPQNDANSSVQHDVTSPRRDVNSHRQNINVSRSEVKSPRRKVNSRRPDVNIPQRDVTSPLHEANSTPCDVSSPRHSRRTASTARQEIRSPRRIVSGSYRTDVSSARRDPRTTEAHATSAGLEMNELFVEGVSSQQSNRGYSGKQLSRHPGSSRTTEARNVWDSASLPDSQTVHLQTAGHNATLHPRSPSKVYDCVIGNSPTAAICVDNGRVTFFRKMKPDVTQSVYCAVSPYRVTRDDGSYLSHLRKVYLSAPKDLPKTSSKQVDKESHEIVTKRMDYDRKVGHILEYYTKVDVCERLHSPRPPGTHQPPTSPRTLPGKPAFRTIRSRKRAPPATAVCEPVTGNPPLPPDSLFSPRSPRDYPPCCPESLLHAVASDPDHFVRINVQARLHDRQFYLCTPGSPEVEGQQGQLTAADGNTYAASNSDCRLCCMEAARPVSEHAHNRPLIAGDTVTVVSIQDENYSGPLPFDPVLPQQQMAQHTMTEIHRPHSLSGKRAPSECRLNLRPKSDTGPRDPRLGASWKDTPQSLEHADYDMVTTPHQPNPYPSFQHPSSKASSTGSSVKDKPRTVSVDLSVIQHVTPGEGEAEEVWTDTEDRTIDGTSIFHQSTQTDECYDCIHNMDSRYTQT